MADSIPTETSTVIFLAGGANDAPGLALVHTSHGWKIVKVGGWSIDQLKELSSALGTVSAAAGLHAHRSGPAIVDKAATIVHEQLGQYLEHVSAAHPELKTGATTVVVVVNR